MARTKIAMALMMTMALAGCGGDDPATGDRVVREVVQQLEAGVGTPQIEEWLERTDARPGPIGPAEERALERAGAPPHLIQRLREMEGAGAVELPPGLPATTDPTPPATATRPPQLADQPEQTQMSAPGEPGGVIDGTPLQLTVRARGVDGDLVVALDGMPILRAPAGSTLPVTSAPSLQHGRHVLRAFVLPTGASSMSGARALETPLVLDAAVGQEWIAGLEASSAGATWTASRGGAAERRVSAGAPAAAQPLCPSGQTSSGCLQWQELWPVVGTPPSLERADAALRRFDLAPAPGS